jgi:hypothetical protein
VGEFGNALYGRVAEAGQDLGEVVPYPDLKPAAAFDDGQDGGNAWSSLWAADMDPVGSAKGDWPH